VLAESLLQAAMLKAGVYPAPLTPPMSEDEFVARVTGLPLPFHRGRDGCTTPASTCSACCRPAPGPDGLEMLELPDGAFAGSPGFEELSSGLISTAPNLLRFFCANGGRRRTVLTAARSCS
jgi:hypothetical protein